MKLHSTSRKMRLLLALFVTVFLLTGGKNREPSDLLESPISLTTSDGAGLILKSYESNTVLDGFFAFTEIKLSFYNPEDRQREGRFRISLPDNAHLARFSMLIGDRWQEGEVVEKEKATRVYEDFLHRKQDPALLESDAGNEFSARIFPITAKAEKKLIISYSTSLRSFPIEYSLPVRGLPQMEDFQIRVLFDEGEFGMGKASSQGFSDGKITTRKLFSLKKSNYKPTHDVKFEHKIKGNLFTRSGNLFAAQFIPIAETKDTKAKIKNLVLLVDTSASAAIQFKETLAKLDRIVKELNPGEFQVFGFDTSLISYGKGGQALEKLKTVLPLGSSNLGLALAGITKEVELKDVRLLVVSDGVATAGEIQKADLKKMLKNEKWIVRLDFLVPGAYKDEGMINSLSTIGSEVGVMASLDSDINVISQRLKSKVFVNPAVNVRDSKWFYSGNLNSLQAGDVVTVFGEMKTADIVLEDSISFNGKKVSNFSSVTSESLLMEREVVAARINRLISNAEEETNEDTAKGLNLQARELSIIHRIQCPLTSFLVLETAEDYDRFQITRNSLSDILTIGLGGLEILNRKTAVTYDFLDKNNIEKRKTERENDNRLLSKPEKNGVSKKKEDGEFRKSQMGISDGDSFESRDESSDQAKILDSVSDISEQSDISPNPAEDKKEAPKRNRFQVDSVSGVIRPGEEAPEKHEKIDPYTGKMKDFYNYLRAGENRKALIFAWEWRNESPEDVLALLAIGDAYIALNDRKNASRAYSSLVDYFPRRADIRRWAGEKLLSMGDYTNAIDTFKIALILRPDHPSTYHLLAISYMKERMWKEAYGVLIGGLNRGFSDRFQSVHDIFYDDMDLLYSLAKNSGSSEIEKLSDKNPKIKLKFLKKEIRFILVWETDANDVDFHIYDKDNNHAYYSQTKLASGGELYADLTGGYGPECFRIINPKAFPYKLEAHYYSRGPMGYGMGALQVIRFDGDKNMDIETRGFVIMNDGAYIDLGKVK